MATELQIQLKQATTLDLFNLSESEIIRVQTDTLGALVTFFKEGHGLRNVTVVETPTQIALLCKTLLAINHTDGNKEWINADHIILIDDSGTGSIIKYDVKGAYAKFFTITETKGAINKEIYKLAGQTVYTISAINLTNDTFTLAAGDGDVTAKFAANKVFSVIGSTGNDGTYTVSSSTFSGGGQTVITVSAISNATADGSILIIV